MDERVELNGRQKAAVLCVSLGPDNAAQIFKHLNDDVIEQLTVEMARTHDVEASRADIVLEEIVEAALARGYLAEGGRGYARDVLERAVGTARAEEILNKLAGAIEATPFDFLRRTPPDQIYEFLRHEHPQTVSVILANLPRMELAAKVLQVMPAELQADVAARIALMGQTSPDVVKEV
ncbi:MAG: flagellar motor switch protein FliG, partial [Gaiellaceae bacterium]